MIENNKKTKVLVTGFSPFGGETINPALEAVMGLDDEIDGAIIIKKEIPTVYRKAIKVLEDIIEVELPDVVICVGQAGGRSCISIERVAINIDDARIDDNEGSRPVDETIYADGENAYFSNLPIKEIVENIKENGIPASVSNSAGTFVCNHIMYGLLYLINMKYPNIKGGFIHVPYLPKQVLEKLNQPSMSIECIKKALTIAISTSIMRDYEHKGEVNCTPTLKVGKKYKHFKGNEYQVLYLAKHSETMEDLVVYKALYGEFGIWVRPLAMFMEQVEVDGRLVNRFEVVE